LHNTAIVFTPFPSNRFRIQLSRSMPISCSYEGRISSTLECMLYTRTDVQVPCTMYLSQTFAAVPYCIFVQPNTSLKPSKIVRQWMKQVQLAQIVRDSLIMCLQLHLVDVEVLLRSFLISALIAIEPDLLPRSIWSKCFGTVLSHPLEHAHDSTAP